MRQSVHILIDRNGVNLYSSRKVKIPKPEVYVILTGERNDKPEYIYLSKEFFGGEECAIEVTVKVIYDGSVIEETGEKDIIGQYVAFTKVYNEQLKLHGRTMKAVTETIRICKDRNLLKEYLENREMEVTNIMMTLFDEEKIMKNYVADEVKEAARKTAERLIRKAQMSLEDIADCCTELSLDEIREIKAEIMQSV